MKHSSLLRHSTAEKRWHLDIFKIVLWKLEAEKVKRGVSGKSPNSWEICTDLYVYSTITSFFSWIYWNPHFKTSGENSSCVWMQGYKLGNDTAEVYKVNTWSSRANEWPMMLNEEPTLFVDACNSRPTWKPRPRTARLQRRCFTFDLLWNGKTALRTEALKQQRATEMLWKALMLEFDQVSRS